jgi:hypothetical protein
MRTGTALLGLIAALVLSSSGMANPPSRFTFTLDDTFPAFGTSAVCGFSVFVHLEGTAAAQLFYDRHGVLIRELDTSPNLKITFFAPSTGKSFTYAVGGPFVQEYVDGAAVGSPVVATLAGLIGATGSSAPNAGRIVSEGVVAGIEATAAARCETLGAG